MLFRSELHSGTIDGEPELGFRVRVRFGDFFFFFFFFLFFFFRGREGDSRAGQHLGRGLTLTKPCHRRLETWAWHGGAHASATCATGRKKMTRIHSHPPEIFSEIHFWSFLFLKNEVFHPLTISIFVVLWHKILIS